MSDSEAKPATADGEPAQALPCPASRWGSTPAAKVAMILGLLLVMQIPLLMVGGLIQERQARQGEVLETFRRGWGPEQVIGGPLLMVPYSWAANDTSGERMHGWVSLPASRMNVVAALQPEERHRGLFHATIYTAAVELSGTIIVPALTIPDLSDVVIDWQGARVAIGVTDPRGMPAHAEIAWNGGTIALQPSDHGGCGMVFLDARAALQGAPAPGTTISFKSVLSLRGTEAFHIMPMARQIDMRIASPWPTPSFTGATLPLDYQLRPNGFDAHWEMAGDPVASGWRKSSDCASVAMWTRPEAQVGVRLQEPVPTYLMVDRASKYGVFFLTLSYLTMFLFEVLSGERIHLVQYGLVGLSISLFALLLISIAEPLGFTIAYAISAAAVMAQASLYILSVVGTPYLAAVFASVLGALFGFLYVVLSLDAYALLAGTIALFTVLSVIMAATRRVNWAATQVAS